jgi:hypothetical protein
MRACGEQQVQIRKTVGQPLNESAGACRFANRCVLTSSQILVHLDHLILQLNFTSTRESSSTLKKQLQLSFVNLRCALLAYSKYGS